MPLRFNAQGPFKVVWFTDLHLKEGNEDDGKKVALMKQVLDAGKLDLVVLTGSILGSSAQPEHIKKRRTEPMAERRIP